MLPIQKIYDAYLLACFSQGKQALSFDDWFKGYIQAKEQAFDYQASNSD